MCLLLIMNRFLKELRFFLKNVKKKKKPHLETPNFSLKKANIMFFFTN